MPAVPALTVEKECQRRCKIPVFHDDQHGTAIIAGAGLLNALDLVVKEISQASRAAQLSPPCCRGEMTCTCRVEVLMVAPAPTSFPLPRRGVHGALQIKVVVCGCGAAGFTCAKYFLSLGVKKKNLICIDLKVRLAIPDNVSVESSGQPAVMC